ncbi:hypothetical protein HAX54_045018, partial [Datura stramonium]|nr:hypothetical protein [Datura stramonium]
EESADRRWLADAEQTTGQTKSVPAIGRQIRTLTVDASAVCRSKPAFRHFTLSFSSIFSQFSVSQLATHQRFMNWIGDPPMTHCLGTKASGNLCCIGDLCISVSPMGPPAY